MAADTGVGTTQPLGSQLKANYCPIRECKDTDSGAGEMLGIF